MKRAYWEKIAPSYNDEIFDVLHNDTKALIRSVIDRYASKKRQWLTSAAPLVNGCRYFPLLLKSCGG
ncbi:MAG: hypothetical protein IPK57_20730 [Chitinophagaceae bacterium]|nr:hypothetical protein [Chitinophagaceae bacterium]